MKYLFILILILVSFGLLQTKAFADQASPISNKNQFITIANPVRISSYNATPEKSLAAEYEQVKQYNFPATWLLTYDVLNNPQIISITKDMDSRQELGILLEISPNFAKDAGIIYKETDSWHRAKALFLSGYTQQERIRLIDYVFDKFKSIYGFYPKSVGAWWVDSFSLDYMQKKYGITASLGCSDQFFTDGYSLWGQYWSTPFYPNKYHAGIPASTLQNKLDVLMLQWAPRDPLNAYGEGHASTYSTQDYHTNNLPLEYYENLIRLYTQNSRNNFGQVTLGLEADLSETTYKGIFLKHLQLIKKLQENENFQITTMETFSNWYRDNFTELSPPQIIESNDLLGGNSKIYWYQSPNYRLGLTYNPDSRKTKIIDFRTYHDNFQEPFYLSTNNQMDLFINIPSLIDGVGNPQSIWNINAGELLSVSGDNNSLTLTYKEKSITFTPSVFSLHNFNLDLPSSFNSSILKIKKIDNDILIAPNISWPINIESQTFQDFPPLVLYFYNFHNLQKPKILFVGIFLFIISIVLIFKLQLLKKKSGKYFLVIIFSSIILFIFLSRMNTYSISQEEVEALYHLKSLPEGKVLVYDQYCLKCLWHSQYMPSAFVNRRDYIGEISKKPLIYNRSFFNSITPQESKKELTDSKAEYIYLVKLENYIEKLPFIENEYNINKIYENANAQIWKVNK